MEFMRIKWNPKRKPLKVVLIDSAIIGAIAFLAALPTAHMPKPFDYYIGIRAFFYSFLVQVAVNYGLLKNRQNNNS